MVNPNWSTIIYDELVWHKIQVIRHERSALANITLKWHEMGEQLIGPLSNQPHIRNLRAAAQHFIASDMRRIMEDFTFYSKAEITKEMFAAYQTMTEQAYVAMRAAEPIAFDLIPWKHMPEETMLEIGRIKYLGSDLDLFVNTVNGKQLKKVSDQFQAGLIAGESVEQVAKRLVETLNYSLIAAKAVARTAINAASNRGLDQIYKANKDLIKGLEYTATLDSSTCEICGGYDGQVYPINSTRPHTPVHINCRCLYVPVMKSAAELGLGPLELPDAVRASMDGGVPESLHYPDWFMKQKAARQQQILGKKKYLDWKAGEYTPKFFKEEYLGGCANLDMMDILFAA